MLEGCWTIKMMLDKLETMLEICNDFDHLNNDVGSSTMLESLSDVQHLNNDFVN